MVAGPNSGESRIRVLVADSTPIHTQLLADALERGHFQVVAAPSDPQELLRIATTQRFDVLILSSILGEDPARGCEVLRELRSSQPDLRGVVLLDSSKREAVVEAFRAGARGVFSRYESVETLCKCVRSVHEGQIWANNQQMAFAVEALSSAPSVRAVDSNGFNLLSKRELEVVRCLAEGLTNREIAEHLGLSQHTIKNYLFRVFDKLGVSSRVELLFMTLSQAGVARAACLPSGEGDTAENDNFTNKSLVLCQKAAEEGLPSAQLALAEMYLNGRGVPRDGISAYMWYVVSEKSTTAVTGEIARAKEELAGALRPEQIRMAETRAAEWLIRNKKPADTAPAKPQPAHSLAKVSSAS